jgi:pimeloyl-ACP methyl ester carboxylesterase
MTDSQGAVRPVFTEHRVHHADVSLYIRDFPGSGPAFVLLHGFPDNSHIYDDLVPHLAAADRRTIAFDFLGFGASVKSEGALYSFTNCSTKSRPIRPVSRISGADLPLLLIWGKADSYLHVSVAEHLKCHASVHTLEAGHWPQIDEVADTARIMLASE